MRFSGRGLHTGATCALELVPGPGPVAFRHGARLIGRERLELARTDRGVRVAERTSGFELELVEHLFGALGGLSIQGGLTLVAHGPEVPLLDGGALELGRGIAALGLPPCEPGLRVARDAELEHAGSLYRFGVADELALDVEVDFPETGPERAAWHGDPRQFLERIAPARTFGFVREASLLARSGRARQLDYDAVLVLDAAGRAIGTDRPRQPGELARHKLLDLIGDLYLYGGPPRGRLHAVRPGHGATHAVVRRALESGVLVRLGSAFSQ